MPGRSATTSSTSRTGTTTTSSAAVVPVEVVAISVQEDSGSFAASGAGATWTSHTYTYTTTFFETETSTTLTTTVTVFFEKVPADEFPEVDYLFVPESRADVRRLARMKAEVRRYLPPERWGVRLVEAVYPRLWPEGRYGRVRQLCQELPKVEPQCSWTTPEGGGFPHQYYTRRGATSLEECRQHCCGEPQCRAVRFSELAVDDPLSRCLLYTDGEEDWSPERPGYKHYQIHLRGADVERPWWEERNLNIARVGPGDTFPTDEDAWPEHHAGCGLSHLMMWLDAQRRGVTRMVVLESDGFPSELENGNVGGNASDWAALLRALPSRAPEGWHLIMLDKGLFGAKPNATAAARIQLGFGDRRRLYDLVPWGGGAVAGCAAYMISRAFLEWFPFEIRDRGFHMVDAWLESHCGEKANDVNPNPLNCYSVVAAR